MREGALKPDTLIDTFESDVVRDLQRTPKQLQARYLYDALGSSLFDAICRLPWYRITRAEAALLARHAPEVADAVLRRGGEPTVVELGCGNGEKLETIVAAIPGATPATVHLIDISVDALTATSARLARFPRLSVVRHHGSYEDGLADLRGLPHRPDNTLILFLGSNLGNFDRGGAQQLLRAIRVAAGDGARLLLGTDLVKPARDLLLAYDDPLGVTAAFNLNLLVRINRELGADFDIGGFEHRAIWNEGEQRVEMHLVSRRSQEVRLAATGTRVAFAAGESIWTESSYKFTEAAIEVLAAQAGFSATAQWIEAEARFALTLLEAR